MKKIKTINLPMTKEAVLSLHVGDTVLINGKIVTGRDKLHKFLFNEKPSKKEIPFNLDGTIIFHCGPVIRKTKKGFNVISAGPTTSIRMEMYQHQVISEYGLRGVMGKGGMGRKTLDALKKFGCVYLHTIGGAAAYLADRIKRVIDVWKLEEFGYTDAMWVFDVKEFPAIVTMDAHGRSLHEEIEKKSFQEFRKLISLD
jgi:tartrate/fumarate subfamily iron-sulfur-dependent hydro-lyase beta chain